MSLKTKTVLHIDDLPEWRDVLRRILEASDKYLYQFWEASNSDEALTLLSNIKPDIAICDLRLSEIDEHDISGMELASAIKQLHPNCKILIVTGYIGISIVRQIFENGYELIEKSGFAPDEILKYIDSQWDNLL